MVLPYVTTWIVLEDIMLSEINQRERKIDLVQFLNFRIFNKHAKSLLEQMSWCVHAENPFKMVKY